MKQENSKSIALSRSRCRHDTVNGRRCHLRVLDAPSGLCFRHFSLAAAHGSGTQVIPPDDADLTAAFAGELSEFKNASQINDFLSRLLVLLAQNRISSRRAAVLAYITNQLLRTLSAIQNELDAQSPQDAATPDFIMDLPRPVRPQTSDPS